ncbi:MAG: hypothetical protein EA423_08940 [Phycisphaerales bacterium]|nr:MAG: hypothetical protein EA423_08940 [Phycisphaerales bacterium]
MAVVLRNNHGQFTINNAGWVTLLRLAWDYGWRPAGTSAPEHWIAPDDAAKAWSWNNADYVTGRGQRVSANDARLLAEALEAIIDDLPNHDPDATSGIRVYEAPGFPTVLYIAEDRQMTAFERLGGRNKQGFAEFLAFCRGGSFTIW